ncbi:hypothetical protein HYY75_12305, partial [bacterium]|nr:hypothetical protein [bacterium]
SKPELLKKIGILDQPFFHLNSRKAHGRILASETISEDDLLESFVKDPTYESMFKELISFFDRGMKLNPNDPNFKEISNSLWREKQGSKNPFIGALAWNIGWGFELQEELDQKITELLKRL